MKLIKNLFIITLLLTASSSLRASSGHVLGSGISFGGADEHFTIESAWFHDSRSPVKVCFEIAPDSKYSDQQISSVFIKASGLWQSYLKDKNLVDEDLNPLEQINHQYDLEESCTDSTQLKVIMSPSLPDEAQRYFEDPVSAAYMLEDKIGVIWLKSDDRFKDENYLLAILTHEIGHTLGLNHNAQTIMDAGIAEFDPKLPVKIDLKRELAICSFCHIERSVELDSHKIQQLGSALEEVGILVDFKPTTAKVEIIGKGKSRSSQPFYILNFQDDAGNEFNLQLRTGMVRYQFVQEIFLSEYAKEKSFNFTSIDYAYLDFAGKEYAVQVEYNALTSRGQYRFSFLAPRGKLIPFLEL